MDELLEALKTLDLPLAYNHFAEGEVPELPWICYWTPRSNNMFADDRVYLRVDRVFVELYTARKDLETEARMETALAGYTWDKSESYIDTEDMYQTTYEIEV